MLNQEFSDMLSALNDEEVEFLVVGAFALSAHGLPRATGDIDVWVRSTPENAIRVLRALRRFGAPLADVTEKDFETPGTGLHIGVPPYRVDVLTEVSGLTFEEAWENRLETHMDQHSICVLGLEDMLKNKQAANRPKDRIDVAFIRNRLKRGR